MRGALSMLTDRRMQRMEHCPFLHPCKFAIASSAAKKHVSMSTDSIN